MQKHKIAEKLNLKSAEEQLGEMFSNSETLNNIKKQKDLIPLMDEIEIINDDVLNADTDVIAHQVNCFTMGSGVAKAIFTKYPIVKSEHARLCAGFNDDNRKALLGHVQEIEVKKGKYIFNLFGQYDYGRKPNHQYTLLSQLRTALETAISSMQYNNLKSIAFPYLIGCDRGGAKIKDVDELIREVFYGTGITVKYYKI